MVKKVAIFLFVIIIITACQTNQTPKNEIQNDGVTIDEKESKTVDNKLNIPIEIKENEARFAVADLFEVVEGDYYYDEKNRTLDLTIGQNQFSLIHGVPVLEQNGIYIPNEDIYLIIEEDQIYLPVAFLNEGLDLSVTYSEDSIAFEWFGPAEMVAGEPENFTIEDWDIDRMVDYLSFLKRPLLEAEVSTISNHLPGAKRGYRNGYHEGVDWYSYATGAVINQNTPVYAMAEGIVVRADHNFEDYETAEIRNKDLNITTELSETPEYIVDRLRGRQVWVQYENGVMNRFAHLDAIPETIKVGNKVNSETVIGYVGNSGTSGAVNGDNTELHLHQDILIYGEYFWEPFTLEEVKEIVVQVFGEK